MRLLIAIEVSAFDAARGGDVTLKIRCEIPRAGIVRKLAALVRDFPGESRVNLILRLSDCEKQLGARSILGPENEACSIALTWSEN